MKKIISDFEFNLQSKKWVAPSSLLNPVPLLPKSFPLTLNKIDYMGLLEI